MAPPDIRSFFSNPKGKSKPQVDEKENSSRKPVSADEFFSTKSTGKRKPDDRPAASMPSKEELPSPSKKAAISPNDINEILTMQERSVKDSSVEDVKPAAAASSSVPVEDNSATDKRRSVEHEATAFPNQAAPRNNQRVSPSNRPADTVSLLEEEQSDATKKPKVTTSFNLDEATPQCLLNMTFVFTGVMEDLNREEAQEIVKTLGGRVTTAVSGKTDYLVAGEILEDNRPYTEGSKYRKAAEQPDKTTVLLGAEAFYELLQKKSDSARNASPPSVKPTRTPVKPAVPPAVGSTGNPYKKTTVNPYTRSTAPTNPYARTSSGPTASSANPYIAKDAKPSASASKLVTKGGPQLWVDKYKPSSTEEILGNQELVRKLTNWLDRWEDTFNRTGSYDKSFSAPQGPWKAALLSGPPGIGKTTTATLVANQAGRDVVEFNASDVRSKKALQTGLGDIGGSHSISFGNTGKAISVQKRCIIMDEVDGMGAGDRSGISELIQMIKHSRVPIICICNDRQSQKIKSLVAYCMDLRFRRPTKSVIARRAISIAANEGLTVENNAAEAIAESCGNDIRQVLNCLQMWASNNSESSSLTYKGLKDREKSINKDEILRIGLFDAARTIMEGRRGLSGASPEAERSSFFNRNDAFFVDYSFTGLLVQQNYLKVIQGQFNDAKRTADQESIYGVLERMHSAAESMSDYTHAEAALRGGQNWNLLPFCASLAVKTGYHAGGPSGGSLPGFPEFTTWLGRNSTKGKKQRLMSELHHHFNYHISGGTQQMRLSYLPVFRSRLLSLLNSSSETSVDEAIAMMDEYGLDRDDVFEKLDEFKMDQKSQTFANIDSKKKALFTRAYNQGSHKSQALVAEQGGTKKVKRGSSSVAADTFDPDAIDDDKADEEDEDDNEDEDFEKIKAMFKKKGRKKAATKSQKKK